MKFQGLFNSAMIAVLVALQGWTLSEIVALKVEVARVHVQLDFHLAEKHNPPTKAP